MKDWLEIKNNIQAELVSITKLLDEVRLSEYPIMFEISTKDLLSQVPDDLKHKIKAYFSNFKKAVIYTVALKGCKDYNAINTAFDKAKSSKIGGRSYSKHNNVEKGLLYVGSSQSKYLVTRMRNHLGLGSRTVYSMHLKEWLPKDLNCIIEIRVFEVHIPNNNIQLVKMLELVEQGLWDANKPLFGKRSGLL